MAAAIVGSATLGFAMVLYILIALGQPYGEYAMGGKNRVVPKGKRLVFGISVVFQAAAIIVLCQTAGAIPMLLPQHVTRGICIFFAAFLTLNVFANLFSRSKKERYLMTPLSATTAICFWIAAVA